ncbi:MAG: MBL fold metallo-hydrolase [Candidatus Yanofskybacteria bacterium]|nr:MBL fold metallo-hydrolase [Candidatus Yanofskybacteria bacterium]
MLREKLIYGIILGALIVLVVATGVQADHQDGLLKVTFLDVGQGDAIFIQTPNGNQILIDGGPNGSVLSKLAEVMPFQDRDIDMIVLTHPHTDHMNGLIEVLDRYKVYYIVQAKETYDSREFRAWQEAVAEEKTNEIEALAGQEFDFGAEVKLTVLHPTHSVAGTTTKTPHDDVVVTELSYKDTKVLLTGDMETEVEDQIMSYVNVDADVLKIGHHGSKTSTSSSFLNAVTPQVAIIQVGQKNRYGHPSKDVLNRLDNSHIPYYRTDTNGGITLVSDGSHIVVQSKK